ncbi:MAG: hypothetical protein ACQES0_06395 [Bacteroidota bacterium]
MIKTKAKTSGFLKNLSQTKVEFGVVFFLTILNAAYLFVFKYTPSLDGAQHLYNSNVIGQILKGNDFVQRFFEINDVIVGYWTAHTLLSSFNLIFPAWLADKMFLLLYLIATPLLFRYMIRAFNPQALYTTILILPVVYNSYYFMGYYAFIIAWPVVFLLLGYFFRHIKNMQTKHWLVLSILFLLAFFSHMIVFSFTLAVVFGWLVFDQVFTWIKTRKIYLKHGITRIVKTLLVLLPALVLAVVYVKHVFTLNKGTSLGEVVSKSFSELWQTFTNLSVLVGFTHEKEGPWNVYFFWVMASLLLIALVYAIVQKYRNTPESDGKQRYVYFWGLICLAILVFYFVFPNTFGTGNVSNRILVFFLFSCVAFLAIQNYPKWIHVLIVVSVIVYSVGMYNVRKHPFKKQNQIITDFMHVQDFMKPNSTYITLRCHEVWNNLHYGCYVGAEKPLVCLNSPQNLGHFPVVWNYDEAPKSYIGLYPPHEIETMWFDGSENGKIRPIDYVVVYGHHNFLNNEKYSGLKQKTLAFYELAGKTEKNHGAVYKFSLENYILEKTKFINSHQEWPEKIKEKAKKRGVSLEDMYYLDIMYMHLQTQNH